jgi:quinol monooxygenase YgiN
MTSSLRIVAIATAVAGREDALRTAQEQLVQETVNEPGCLRYELSQSLDDPRVLVFTEIWATEKQWRAHMQGAAIRRFQASGAGDFIQDFALIRAGLVADGVNA